jgi:hypothetical protein
MTWKGLKSHEKATIKAYAAGNRGLRDEAVAIYRAYIRDWNCQWGTDAYMDFMSEVDTPAPDYSLRGRYRMRVIDADLPR